MALPKARTHAPRRVTPKALRPSPHASCRVAWMVRWCAHRLNDRLPLRRLARVIPVRIGKSPAGAHLDPPPRRCDALAHHAGAVHRVDGGVRTGLNQVALQHLGSHDGVPLSAHEAQMRVDRHAARRGKREPHHGGQTRGPGGFRSMLEGAGPAFALPLARQRGPWRAPWLGSGVPRLSCTFPLRPRRGSTARVWGCAGRLRSPSGEAPSWSRWWGGAMPRHRRSRIAAIRPPASGTRPVFSPPSVPVPWVARGPGAV